jgi:hypothetical protein
MKLLGVGLVVAAMWFALPSTSQAQVRVRVNVGVERYYGHRYGFTRWHRVNRYPVYARYGSYPAPVIIVRRHFRPAPVIVVRSRHRSAYRHW